MLLFLLACAPAERPDWTPGDDQGVETLTAYSDARAANPPDLGGLDTGLQDDSPQCEDFAGLWTFNLTIASGACALPTAQTFQQSLTCNRDGTFNFDGSFPEVCTLEGYTFGCHSPDASYSLDLAGTFSGSGASGSWIWQFPSDCDFVSGTFAATR
jgi:hypothetical protein